jgi:hypothetical protein
MRKKEEQYAPHLRRLLIDGSPVLEAVEVKMLKCKVMEIRLWYSSDTMYVANVRLTNLMDIDLSIDMIRYSFVSNS